MVCSGAGARRLPESMTDRDVIDAIEKERKRQRISMNLLSTEAQQDMNAWSRVARGQVKHPQLQTVLYFAEALGMRLELYDRGGLRVL